MVSGQNKKSEDVSPWTNMITFFSIFHFIDQTTDEWRKRSVHLFALLYCGLENCGCLQLLSGSCKIKEI